MSLPTRIPLQSVPFGEKDQDGNIFVDFNWYLFLYNIAQQVFPQGPSGGGGTPVSPFDVADLVDLDAAASDVPQAYRQIANTKLLEAGDIEVSSADVPRLSRDVTNVRVMDSVDAELSGADIAGFARALANAQLQAADQEVVTSLRDLANAVLLAVDSLQMDAALVRSNNLSELSSPATARLNLGLGSMATQNANAVAITGGAIDGTVVGGTAPAAVNGTTVQSHGNDISAYHDFGSVFMWATAAGNTHGWRWTWTMNGASADGSLILQHTTDGYVANFLNALQISTANLQVGIPLQLAGGTLLSTSAALTNGAGSAAGTLANAPAAGNPTKWVPVNDNGTTRYVPMW